MAFKKKKKNITTYDTPEALFRDRWKRTIPGPLSHQSDILRRYQEKAFNHPNVALELPTGSGKTLVGLLIAEFRRLTKGERVLYLCPTKQLALQVCEQSERKYGITATPFIGKKKDYLQDDKQKYQTGQTIAVAPYSALFNINPFFDSPQLIILDDAHAAENYIAANWSLLINRKDYLTVYLGLLDIIKYSLPSTQQQRFFSDKRDELSIQLIEKVPTKHIQKKVSDIIAFLDVNTRESGLYYAWSLLRDHLDACHLFISYDQILLRPYIPPSLSHKPFADATQRVFMSATLGLGGDLERITGIPSFHRLEIPIGWDKQGIGRRYFIFPEMSLSMNEVDPLIVDMVKKAGRALILVPSDRQSEKYLTLFNKFPIYNARDIEISKDKFVAEKLAIAVLANRYDGIDLLDDDCRLLIIDGLPKAGNLQEIYLMTRMVAGNLFKDRIRTRMIQSFGRCTRSPTDYATIVILGEDFYDWLVLKENRALFHPELQGELLFGTEQSEETTHDEIMENLDIFLAHNSDWDDADKNIIEYRDEATQIAIPSEEKLFAAAKIEVKYIYSLWDKDYSKCHELAEHVSGILSGDDLKGLRGFWYYLAASSAELAYNQLCDDTFKNKAGALYKRASACLSAASWLRALAAQANSSVKQVDTIDHFLNSNVEKIELLFEQRSFALPQKFETAAKDILDGLNSTENNTFEEAHRLLGEMLGFEANNNEAHASPDPWWISNDSLCLVAEDKSDSRSDNIVPVKHARQVASHPKWIKDNTAIAQNSEIYSVLITTQVKIHPDVPTYADKVGYWYIDDFRLWASHAIGVLRELRGTYTGPGQEKWRAKVREKLKENHLDPRSIVNTATRKLLRDVEKG